jgi:photosystem II stability/assembly factor-like uncharacterized protein
MKNIERMIIIVLWVLAVVGSSRMAAAETPDYTLTRLDGNLRGIERFSESVAVALGDNGIVLLTRDKARTWQQVPGVPVVTLTSAVALNTRAVLVFGAQGIVMQVDVQSARFMMLPKIRNLTQPFKQCCRLTESIFLCVDSYGAVYRYSPGDTLVSTDPQLSRFNVQCVAGLSSGAVFAGTTQGVMRTLDSGKTWTEVHNGNSLPTSQVIYAHVTESDSLIVEYCNEDQTKQRLFVSGDAGRTWRASPNESQYVGPVLRYAKGDCIVLNVRAGAEATFVRLPSVFSGKVSFGRLGVHDTSRYVPPENLYAGVFFDDTIGVLVGNNKTVFRSTDGGRSLWYQSCLSSVPQPYPDYDWTRAYGDSIVSIAGPDQRFFTSTNGGATWMPRKNPRVWTSFKVSPSAFRCLSSTCFIAGSELRRMDITKDGGETFEHPGIYDADSTVREDLESVVIILSADSVIKIMGPGIAIVTDSCRKWDIRKTLPPRFTYVGDTIGTLIETSVFQGFMFSGYLFLLTNRIVYDMKRNVYTEMSKYVLRTRDFGVTMDTLIAPSKGVTGQFTFRSYGDSSIVFAREDSETKTSLVYMSSDLGMTWDTMSVSEAPREAWIEIPRDSFFIYRQGENLLVTRDSGRTWKAIPQADTSKNFSWGIACYTRNTVFLPFDHFSRSGLYRLDFVRDSGIVQSVEPSEAERPSPIRLRMAKMHPFRARATIGLRADDTVPLVDIHLGVYDLQGNLVSDLTDRLRQTTTVMDDERIIEWDAESVSHGIYYIVARTAGRSVSLPVLKAE